MNNLKSPKDLCLSADGSKLFILDLLGIKHHRILVLNAYDGTYLQTIGMNQIDSSPNSICVSHDGRELFVAQMYGKKIKIFDTTDGTLLRTINCANYPYDICISQDGSQLFYVNGEIGQNQKEIFVLKSANGTRIRTLQTIDRHDVISICTENDKLFCLCKDENIRVMDLFGTHLRTIEVPKNLDDAHLFKTKDIHVSQGRVFALCEQQKLGHTSKFSLSEFHEDGEHVQTINLKIYHPSSPCVSQNRELFLIILDKVVEVFQI
jgi:sugar lactone lactonase YvrE